MAGVKRLKKEEIKLDDGRYLIFYDFEEGEKNKQNEKKEKING